MGARAPCDGCSTCAADQRLKMSRRKSGDSEGRKKPPRSNAGNDHLDHTVTADPARASYEVELARKLAPFTKPNTRQSLIEIALTVVPFAGLWVAAYLALDVGYWLTLLIAIPASAFVVRLFLIQHDCGHGAFFENKAVNDWVGRLLGILTLTPYDIWRRAHAIHHSSSGNLDRRGIGDLNTLTIAEYKALSPLLKFKYRLYRNPIVMFLIGPAYLFLLEHRLPMRHVRKGLMPWLSAMGTNAGIAVFAALLIWAVGWQAFLMVHLPMVIFAASIGVWLFYVQHQFEDTYWAHSDEWSLKKAALAGSSHYDLPQPIRWLTANIGIHHVHHLMSAIPFYRLPEVLKAHPELVEMGRITFGESISAVKLKLWDEERRRLVSFREANI
jgi:omega-6 fatty acid desaturase (delta-12 desaturase)